MAFVKRGQVQFQVRPSTHQARESEDFLGLVRIVGYLQVRYSQGCLTVAIQCLGASFFQSGRFAAELEFRALGEVLNIVIQVVSARQRLATDVHLAADGCGRGQNQQAGDKSVKSSRWRQ
jgi:hypothetical protein